MAGDAHSGRWRRARRWTWIAVVALVAVPLTASPGAGATSQAAARQISISTAPAVARIAGKDRYETAVAASRAAFSPGVPVVYVATGTTFPDGLSGAAAAAHQGGPLLLVPRSGIPAPVAAELARLAPGRIVVQGGTGAVSAATLAELTRYSDVVSRNAGANRYDTALATSRRAFRSGSEVVYVATGSTFPDALGGTAAAAHDDAPLLLVPPGDTLPAAVEDEIGRLGATTARILGGPAVVSPQIERALGAVVDSVERLGGADRYGTAAITATETFWETSDAVIATGLAFPDALAGGPFAATLDAPIFFVPGTCVPQYVLDDLDLLGVRSVSVLGGTGAVASAAAALKACATPPWLVRTNEWRAAYGSDPVREDPLVSGDIAAHLFYLDHTGSFGPTESAGSRWYTANGAFGGATSILARGDGSVDHWIAAPFEAIYLLDPLALTVGYSRYGGLAGLGTSVLTEPPDPDLPGSTMYPLVLPSDGQPTTLTTMEKGALDPTYPCGPDYGAGASRPTAGLPIIVTFGAWTAPTTRATVSVNRDAHPVAVCVVTEASFYDSTASRTQAGQAILHNSNSVLIIPKKPLEPGHYVVTITTNSFAGAPRTFDVP